MEHVNLNRLAYFTAVADGGSFTRAAQRLGVTKTVVSQQVAKLEHELQTTLLMRSTRRVELTEAGRVLHSRSVTILADAQDALAEIAQSSAGPVGLLRIAAPNDYGTLVVAPLAAAFVRRHYPACQVDLRLSDTRIDPIAHRIDLSIRVGWLADSSLQARRIGLFRQFLVAAPELAATLLDGNNPDDMSSVPFVANSALRDPLVWSFTGKHSECLTIRMRQAMAIESTPAVLAATIAGAGLSVLPDFVLSEPLKDGRLVVLCPNWSLPTGGIYSVFPTARFHPPKVTAFVDMLAQHLRSTQATWCR